MISRSTLRCGLAIRVLPLAKQAPAVEQLRMISFRHGRDIEKSESEVDVGAGDLRRSTCWDAWSPYDHGNVGVFEVGARLAGEEAVSPNVVTIAGGCR